MRTNKRKKGISLIVLVITIIIMIILAAAIILSLTNSGIIGNAKEATRASDKATKMEMAEVAIAEYELGKDLNSPNETVTEYVKRKLASQGIDSSDIAVTEDRKVVVGKAANAIASGLKIGDYVAYTPVAATSTKYKVAGSETYFATQADLKWQYMGMDDSGNVIIVADKATTGKLVLIGKEGYLQGPKQLNELCKELYSSEKGTGRSINVEDVNSVLNYTGPKGIYWNSSREEKTLTKPETIGELAKNESNINWLASAVTPDGKDIKGYKADCYYYTGTDYKAETTAEYKLVFKLGNTADDIPIYWLASPCVDVGFDDGYAYFYVRCVYSGHVVTRDLFYSSDIENYNSYAVRPTVTLKSNIQIGDKAESGEWQLN